MGGDYNKHRHRWEELTIETTHNVSIEMGGA